MNIPLSRLPVAAVVHNARANRRGGLLDIRFGISLLRDRTVPAARKLLALAMGGGLTLLLVTLELPIETLVAGLLNLFGFGLDMLLDGMEIVVFPLLIACLLLPHVLPKELRSAKRADYIGPSVE
jgi:hypothetical protein